MELSIIELGRGMGNSTAAFTEAIAPGGRVLSLCRSRSWDSETLPRLRPLVDEAWLSRLDVRRVDIAQR